MGEPANPNWIILQRHGMVPDRKGPFYHVKEIEGFLRELYSMYPGCICIVISGYSQDGWYPEHGHAWLDIYGDKRKRHPRKDEYDGQTKPIGYLRRSGVEALKIGSAAVYRRRDWQANIPVYAYPPPATRADG